MQFNLSPKDLMTRGGVLDELLESAFDVAIILDQNGIVLYETKGASKLTGIPHGQGVGRHIEEVDPDTPFRKVLETGKGDMVLVNIKGRRCLSNIYPVKHRGALVGVIAVFLFKSLSNLKSLLATLNESEVDNGRTAYDSLAKIDVRYAFEDFIGETPIVKNLLQDCRRAAAHAKRHPVLILGETGCGKEILANAFHGETMKRRVTPFIKINCTAIPNELLESELFGHEMGAFTGAVAAKKGKFELASGGSILLDEIGDMDLRLQSKLLRVLEEGEYERIGGTKILPLNARVIASTNLDLQARCREGRFRSDLYYRLNTIEIRIPPLRARKADIPLIIRHFLEREELELDLTPEAIEVMQQYDWPGNVRELRNFLNWMSISGKQHVNAAGVRRLMAEKIGSESPVRDPEIPSFDPPAEGSLATLEDIEAAHIQKIIVACHFNLSKAANLLSISRATLYNKVQKYQLKCRSDF